MRRLPDRESLSSRRRPAAFAASILAIVFVLAPETARAGERLIDRFPWLNDRSVWRQDIDLRKTPAPARESLGAFAIGNGLVFAHEGLAIPSNRIEGLIGPTHALPAGETFGDAAARLFLSGEPLDLPIQETMRIRRAPIVVTKAGRPGEVELFTVDFAPPGKAALLRVLFVLNVGGKALRDAEIRVEITSARAFGATLRAEAAGGARLAAGVLGAPPAVSARDGEIRIGVPEIPPGGEAFFLQYLATSASPEEEAALVAALEARGIELLGDTRRHWDAFFRTLLDLDTPDARVDDFVDDTIVSIEVQRSRATGAFAPLVSSREAGLREATGPVLAYLDAGAHEEVRSYLDYAGRAAASLGRLPDAIPPGFAAAAGASLDEAAWDALPIPRAEVPSWFLLQHAWYARASGDMSLGVAFYPLLRRAFLGQEIRPNGDLPFHGGEPYLRSAAAALFPGRVSWPNEFLAIDPAAGRDGASLDSALLFVTCAEPLRRFAEAAERPSDEIRAYSAISQKVRRNIEGRFFLPDDARSDRTGRYAPALSPLTGAPHEAPLAPVSLRPLFIGYQSPTNRRVVSHLDATIAMLYDAEAGRWRQTPSCAFTTDAAAGYGLKNLAAIDDPDCPRAMKGLLDSASPSGDFAAIHGPDGRPAADGVPGPPRRLLPGRAGLELHGLLSYLVGREGAGGSSVELAPRLPAAWAKASYKNVRAGDAAIDVTIEREAGAIVHTFLNRGFGVVEATARLLFEGATVTAATLNGKPFNLDGLELRPRPGGSQSGVFVAQLPGGLPVVLRAELAPSKRGIAPLAETEYAPRPLAVEGVREILLAAEAPDGAEPAAPGRLVVDVGLPLRPETIAAALVDSGTGRRRVDRLVIAAGARAAGPRTFKTAAFWSAPALAAAIERFRADGGEVVEAAFKGREIHGRYANGAWRFAILPGTNRPKSGEEIEKALSIDGIDALAAAVAALPPGEFLSFAADAAAPEPEVERARAAARAAAAKAGIRADF